MNNFYNTENVRTKGRGGDNTIRTVKGEASHVNPFEAYLIDTYNKAGENLVSQIGSGTINPETGMREYTSWLARQAGWGGASSWVEDARSDLRTQLGSYAGDIKRYLKAGGTLSKIFGQKFRQLGLASQKEAQDITAGQEELLSKTGIESTGQSDDFLANFLKKTKEDFSGVRLAKEEQKKSFLEKMDAKYRQALRDFKADTGYSYSGGSGASQFQAAYGGSYGTSGGGSGFGDTSQGQTY